MTYSDLLKDPRWQKKRLKILERDEWKCRICFDEKDTLNVHHINYKKGKKPFEYDDLDLITLCDGCHAYIHNKQRIIYKKMSYDYGLKVYESKEGCLSISIHLGDYKTFGETLTIDEATQFSELLNQWIKSKKNG